MLQTEEMIELLQKSDLNVYQNASDYFDTCRIYENDKKYDYVKDIFELSMENVKKYTRTDTTKALDFYELARKCALYLSEKYFHYYLIYVEWNREPSKKFYIPRQKTLRVVVSDLQDLADDKLDFLSISLPPRVGKSTLGIFYVTWLMGKYPDMANVMSGHSDKLTKGFYKEVLNILTDSEYLWHDVFPNCSVKNTSAEDESIDINKSKRFPTLTCRSISGTLTGAVEVGKLLYVDDIIEDLEEALNQERLQNKYDAYLNQLKDRKKDKAKELHIGTRWSVADVIGRIHDQYEDNPRYRFRVIPALNENGESNFDYPYGVGFSTRYYNDMRDSIDNATWYAKYMGEPYVREGLLFPADELKYYNGVLPDGEADRKLFVCDVAWGGGDDLVAPFASVYGDSVYITDIVCTNADKTVTQPLMVGRIKRNACNQGRFEANNGGDEYCDNVDRMLRDENVKINLTYKKASNQKSKMAKIIQYAPDIKNFYFIDKKNAGREYNKAMQKLTTFVQNGKNKHDDVPDAMAQLVEYIADGGMGKVEIFKRSV